MAFSTDFSSANMAQTTYIIYRGEPFDASAPLNFFPAKDSDELFDALRSKYSHLKTHSERMREAVIEFLVEEQAAESFSNTTSPNMPSLYDDSTASTSPNWQQSWPSMSSTTQSTPEMLNMATPNFTNSPMFPEAPQFASISRQVSNATGSADTTPPALDQMTSVFALSTSDQPKQRIRRKMTEAEKVEYRKRRIVKACEKCSKRKRKCNHNQPEMETLPSAAGKAGSRVTKSRAPTRPSQHARNEQPAFRQLETSELSFTDTKQSFATTSEGFEDFGFLLNDPMPEVDLDVMLQHFDQPATQHNIQQPRQYYQQNRVGDSPDWSLLSTPESAQADNMGGLLFPDSDFTFDGPLFTGEDQQSTQQQPLEPYRAGSTQLTHTAHLREVESGFGGSQGTFGAGEVASTSPSSGRGTHLQAVPLTQAVLRLNGTTRAVRTFENAIARHNPSRFSQVSMENVATTIGSALAHALGSPRMDGFMLDTVANSALRNDGLDCRQDGVSRVHSEPVLTSAVEQGGFQGRRASAEDVPRDITPRAPGSTQPRPHGMNANETIARANGDGNGTIANGNGISTSARANASSSQQLASTSALTSRISPFDSEVPAYNGRSALLRGSSSTSPSAEMFMLKRRIPKALHSIVDRDSASSSNPLLQVNTTSSVLPIASRQANGGAYLRLDTDNYTRPSTILSEAKSKQETAVALRAAQAEAAKAKHPRFAVAADASTAGRYPLFESDTDTQRNRDHFGRALVSAAMYALCGALLVAAGLSPSLVLLALLCPPSSGKDSHVFDSAFGSFVLPIVHCSVENSAWLSAARGLLGLCPKLEKATSLWYARCDRWRMYQEERQDASTGGGAVSRRAPVEVA